MNLKIYLVDYNIDDFLHICGDEPSINSAPSRFS